MNATLRERRHRWTVDEYRRMGEEGLLGPDARVELIDGEVIHMPPIGSTHAGIVSDLEERFILALHGLALVWAQNPVVLSAHDVPQPDICLLRSRPDRYKRALPEAGDVLLAIEVSDSTLVYDRDYKAPSYAAAGIPESWRIEVGAERIVVLGDPREGRYASEEIVTDPTRLEVRGLPGSVVDLSALF